jgi:hypothetical protein
MMVSMMMELANVKIKYSKLERRKREEKWAQGKGI